MKQRLMVLETMPLKKQMVCVKVSEAIVVPWSSVLGLGFYIYMISLDVAIECKFVDDIKIGREINSHTDRYT